MENRGNIHVTLLANEGILLQFCGTKILIDGIHENKSGDFSGLSKEVHKDLLEGTKALYRDIDYILFTHCHYDHFTAWCTEDFLKKHKVKGLIMPDGQTKEFIYLRQLAAKQAEKLWLLNLILGEKIKILLSSYISVTVFRSNHAGKEYAHIENFCYLLNFAGRNLFIIADAEYNTKYFSEMLEGESIDIAFINPLFMNLTLGREVVTKALRPKRLVVYHIPFEGQDLLGFRKLVLNNKINYEYILPPIDILWDQLQELIY